MLSIKADQESRSDDAKYMRLLLPNKLAKMASPVWQFFKVSEKDNKIAVCNVCEAERERDQDHLQLYRITEQNTHFKLDLTHLAILSTSGTS